MASNFRYLLIIYESFCFLIIVIKMYTTPIKTDDDKIYDVKPYENNQSYQSSFDRPQILMVVEPVIGQPVYLE